MSLLSIIVLAVMISIIAVCVLIGLKSGFFKGILNILLTVLSVILAIFVAKGVSGIPVPALFSALKKNITVLAEAMNVLDRSKIIIEHFAAALIAPILFILLFILVKLLLMIPGKLLTPAVKSIPFFGKDALNRILGALCGILGGVIISVSLLCPITSYAELADECFTYADQHGQVIPQQIKQFTSDHLAGNIVGSIGGDLIFSGLTTFDADGKKTNLIDETAILSTVVFEVSEVSDASLTSLDTEDISHLHAAVDAISYSNMYTVILSEVSSELAQSWLAHESFLGIANLELDNGSEEVFNALLRVLATTNSKYICDDIDTLISLVAHLSNPEFALFESSDNPNAIMDALCKDGMISGMIKIISDNERMKPLIHEITSLGVRATMEATSINGTDMEEQLMALLEDKEAESYEEIVKNLATTAKVLQNTSSENATLEEKADSIVDLLANMGTDGGEAVKIICQPEQIESLGIDRAHAASFSDIMSDMVDSINNAKENGMTEDRYQEEAAAIGDMFHIMTSLADDNQSVFTAIEENDKTAEDIVKGVLDSQIMSDVVKTTDASFENALSESDKNTLQKAIESFNNEDANTDTLESLASMFGITLQ